jgi:hypothetical protein
VVFELVVKHHDDVVSQGATDERMHIYRVS